MSSKAKPLKGGSTNSGGGFRLRAKMRTLGRGATGLAHTKCSTDPRELGRACMTVTLIDEDIKTISDEILLHREHLVETPASLLPSNGNNKSSMQQPVRFDSVTSGTSGKRMSLPETNDQIHAIACHDSLRIKTIETFFKFIELSCTGTHFPDISQVDLFVGIDCLSLGKDLFNFLELRECLDKIRSHRPDLGNVEWYPILSDAVLKKILSKWISESSQRRASNLHAALQQIERFLLGKGKVNYPVAFLGTADISLDPAQYDDPRVRQAQGLHEIWELALQSENHSFFNETLMESVLDLLEHAERNSLVQEIAAGSLQAITFGEPLSREKLKDLHAHARAFNVLHNNIGNLVIDPPPPSALHLIHMLSNFARDLDCIPFALEQLGFFGACIQSGASTKICAAITTLYLQAFSVTHITNARQRKGTKCDLMKYSCTALERELSSTRRRRSKQRRSSTKGIRIGPHKTNNVILGDFLRELLGRAAEPACKDLSFKLAAITLLTHVAHGSEFQELHCLPDCTGRVQLHEPSNVDQLPVLHPLRDFMLASRIVPASISSLGRWALAKILRRIESRVASTEDKLRRIQFLVSGLDTSVSSSSELNRASTLDSINSATEDDVDGRDTSNTLFAKGYLGDFFNEDGSIISSQENVKWVWRRYNSQSTGEATQNASWTQEQDHKGQGHSRKEDTIPDEPSVYIIEILLHCIKVCYAWAMSLNKQCVIDENTFVRYKFAPGCVTDKDIDAIVLLLLHVLGFSQEGWFQAFLDMTYQHANVLNEPIEDALRLTSAACERLFFIPQISNRILRRSTESSCSHLGSAPVSPHCKTWIRTPYYSNDNISWNTLSAGLMLSQCTNKGISQDDLVFIQRPMNSEPTSLGPCIQEEGSASKDDINLHQVQALVHIQQEINFPSWPFQPTLCAIAVQNASNPELEASYAQTLFNLLSRSYKAHYLVASYGGLGLLLSYIVKPSAPLKFVRLAKTNVLLAASIMLFAFGPVSNEDLTEEFIDLKNKMTKPPVADKRSGTILCADSGQQLERDSSSITVSRDCLDCVGSLLKNYSRKAYLKIDYANCTSCLATTVWALARHHENASLMIDDRHTIKILAEILSRYVQSLDFPNKIGSMQLSLLENVESSMNALWMLASYAVTRSTNVLPDHLEKKLVDDFLLYKIPSRVCEVLRNMLVLCEFQARHSTEQPPEPAESIIQRLVMQSLNLLWTMVDSSPSLLVCTTKKTGAWALNVLFKCSAAQYVDAKTRERSTNLIAHIAHLMHTSKDTQVVACKGVLKEELRAENMLKLVVGHLKESKETLRTAGALLFARLPMVEEDFALFKASKQGLRLLELATESSLNEQRAAVLALLRYAESDVGQKEIAKYGFYRLLVGCWVAADNKWTDLQNLLSALLQRLAENTSNRTKIYQAELRAKEIAGWAFLKDHEWVAAQARVMEHEADALQAAQTNRRDVRRAFEDWLIDLEVNLKIEAGEPAYQSMKYSSTNSKSPRAGNTKPIFVAEVGDTLSAKQSATQANDTFNTCSAVRQCLIEKQDLHIAMTVFRAHRLALEPIPEKTKSPDNSMLWPFRSIILNSAAHIPGSESQNKMQTEQECEFHVSRPETNNHGHRHNRSYIGIKSTSYESTKAEGNSLFQNGLPNARSLLGKTYSNNVEDLDTQIKIAKQRAFEITNKMNRLRKPEPPSTRRRLVSNVTSSSLVARQSRGKSSPCAAGEGHRSNKDQLIIPCHPQPWKCSMMVQESQGEQPFLHESSSGPDCKHSVYAPFTRAQFRQANDGLSQRLRSPVNSLWDAPISHHSPNPWNPNIKYITENSVTVERKTFTFSPSGSTHEEETPSEFLTRVTQRAGMMQRPKREKMALFGHIHGARVYKDLPLIEAPEGHVGFAFYNGPRDVINMYLDFEQLGAPPHPTSLFALGRMKNILGNDEQESKSLSLLGRLASPREVLSALPGLPKHTLTLNRSASYLKKLEPMVRQEVIAAKHPSLYSQNHEDGARLTSGILGETFDNLDRLERGQAETGIFWTPDGCILDNTLPFAIRVPGRIKNILEGPTEEVERPKLCVEAFDGRRAFLDENPIAKACANVDWELNMQKKGFREFLGQFECEDVEIARDLLVGSSPLLLSIYRFYCALTPQNPFAMLPPSFLRLLTDIKIIDKRESTFSHDCTNIFIRVASMVPEVQDAKIKRLNEQCDPLGLKKSRRLMRNEFFDVILRIAHAKYYTSESHSLAAALDQFLQFHVVRYLGPETILDFDSWRVRYLYTEGISVVYNEHKSMLMQWFTEMAGSSQRSSRWGGAEKERLSFREWNQGLRQVGLYTANFTIRESTFAFVLSTTNVVNWVAEWEPMIALSYQDFLEALGRVAELITIPTTEQLEFFGVEDIVQFYTLMERTNLWSAIDQKSLQALTRLKLWMRSKPSGDDFVSQEDDSNQDSRPLEDKLAQFLTLLSSRKSMDERREAENTFWVGKRRRGSTPSRASRTDPLEDIQRKDINSAFNSDELDFGTPRRRSLVDPFAEIDLEGMVELDEDDVNAVSGDMETFEVSTATQLHEVWRSNRKRLEDGTFEPRIKVINKREYDIANLHFQQLPDYFKLENLLASHAACESIRRCWSQTLGDARADKLKNFARTLRSSNFIEKASAEQHENWLKRNGKLSWVTDEQRKSYEELSEEEKQKDRDIVLVAVKVYLETQLDSQT